MSFATARALDSRKTFAIITSAASLASERGTERRESAWIALGWFTIAGDDDGAFIAPQDRESVLNNGVTPTP